MAAKTNEVDEIAVRGSKGANGTQIPYDHLHRIQDIQAQPYFIDPITEDGADIVIDDYATVIDGVLESV